MVSTIKIFEVLKSHFGDAEAKFLIEEIEKIDSSIETKVEKAFDIKKDIMATKTDVAESKNEIIKWMFIFWVGQFTVLVGFAIAILLKIK